MGWIIFFGLVIFVIVVISRESAKQDLESKNRIAQAERERASLDEMAPYERELALRERGRQNEKIKIQQEQVKAQKEDELINGKYGQINPSMICPHCQEKGRIRTIRFMQKKGVSGGKATAAVLTGGLSVLAVGLTHKEGATQAHCGNCKNTWLL